MSMVQRLTKRASSLLSSTDSRAPEDQPPLGSCADNSEELKDELQKAQSSLESLERQTTARVAAAEREAKRAQHLATQSLRDKDRHIAQLASMVNRLRTESAQAPPNPCHTRLDAPPSIRSDSSDHIDSTAGSFSPFERQASAEVVRLKQRLTRQTAELEAVTSDAMAARSTAEAASTELDVSRRTWEDRIAALEKYEVEVLQLRTELERCKRGAIAKIDSKADVSSSPTTPTRSQSYVPATEVSRVEALLRHKEKHVMSQSLEIQRLRHEVECCRDEVGASQRAAALKENHLSVERTQSEKLRAHLQTMSTELEEATGVITSLRTERDDLSLTAATVPALEEQLRELHQRELRHRAFREEHEHCAVTLTEQSVKIFMLDETVARLEQTEANLQRAQASLEAQLAGERRQVAAKEGQSNEMLQRHTIAEAALQAEATKLRAMVDQLRSQVEAKDASLRERSAELEQQRSLLDNERQATEQIGRAAATNLEALEAQADAKVKRLVDEHRDTLATIARLRNDCARLTQEKRQLESDLAATHRDHQERKTTLQRMNLELIETKQLLEKERRMRASQGEELEGLVRHLNDLEGSYIDTTTTSRRITGLLESMTVELSQQVADHLRLEFMRGGTKTAALFQKVFNLDNDTAQTMVGILSHLFLMVRASIDTDQMCHLIGVKEITIRRIVSGFLAVDARHAPTARRAELRRATPPPALYTFSGRERVILLCAAQVRQESTISRLRGNTLVLAKICAFLHPTTAGHPAFAFHRRALGVAGHEGQTVLIHMHPREGRCDMVEAAVSPNGESQVAMLQGALVFEPTPTLSGAKAILHVDRQRQGTFDGNVLRWGPWSQSADQRALPFGVRWERRHDGLLLDTAGAKFREISAEELSGLLRMYSEGATVQDIITDSSWETIPS